MRRRLRRNLWQMSGDRGHGAKCRSLRDFPMHHRLGTTRLLAALTLLACSASETPGTMTSTDPGGSQSPPATGGESLNGKRPFPDDNAWNTVVTSATVDPNSSTLIAACGVRNLHP